MTRPAPTSSDFLDITASSDNRETIFDVVRQTAEHCFMPLTVGGGVREIADIRKLLMAGADKVSINTAAVKRPHFVAEAADKFGNQCIVVAIDAKKVSARARPPRWEIFTHGGRERTGIDAVEFARQVVERGAGEILLTSMDRDGTQERLRHRADPGGRRCRARAGHRLRRRRHARSPGRGHSRRPRRGGARRLDLSLRNLYDRRGQAAYARGRNSGKTGLKPPPA